MVTYRQASRGVMRTMRAIDRGAKRAQRQRLAHEKAAQKLEMLEAAADAVAEYEEMIEALTGSHRVSFSRIDWATRACAPQKSIPGRVDVNENVAREALRSYRPGWFAKTFGLESGQRQKLERAIETAIASDDQALADSIAKVKAYNDDIAFAKRVIALQPDAVTTALNRFSALDDLPFCIEGLDLFHHEDGRIVALADGLELEDMPTQSITLLQSGKASIKAIPKGRIQEIYRENICSSGLRVAIEFLQVVPVDAVEVVVHGDLLDPSTGHIESQPLLHVKVSVQALDQVNLKWTEATAVIERLGGHMNWSKKDGFKPLSVEQFNPEGMI